MPYSWTDLRKCLASRVLILHVTQHGTPSSCSPNPSAGCLLWEHSCEISAVEPLLWNPFYGTLAAASLLWNLRCAMLAVESMLFYGTIAVETLLWNPQGRPWGTLVEAMPWKPCCRNPAVETWLTKPCCRNCTMGNFPRKPCCGSLAG